MKNILKSGLGKLGGKINDWRFGSYQISSDDVTREVPTVRDLLLNIDEDTHLKIRKTDNGYFGPAGIGKPENMDDFGLVYVTSDAPIHNVYLAPNTNNPAVDLPVCAVSTAASGVYLKKSGGSVNIYKFDKKDSENFEDYMTLDDFNKLVKQYNPVVIATINSK